MPLTLRDRRSIIAEHTAAEAPTVASPISSRARAQSESLAEPEYQSGFGNVHETEALPGALPVGMRAPQRMPYGLYPEQLSGSSFTAPRAQNLDTWLYRLRPSVKRGRFSAVGAGLIRTAPIDEAQVPAAQLRWDPFAIDEGAGDWVDGFATLAANGDHALHVGVAVHVYRASRSMHERFFQNADGDLLIVPQQGRLVVHTECGVLIAAPGEIALIPRGIVFRVELPDGPSRGFVCESYGAPFRLPERGPAGTSGFASTRDFLAPVAAFEDREGDYELMLKYCGALHSAPIGHSPLDVVAWWGTCAPYKYDLARFNVLGSVSFDQPDPSIYTVLTSPTDTPGVANMDFAAFLPRWQVATNTFRAPPYHRNVMSEFFALVRGVYEARPTGFEPGGASLHNAMMPHGPAAEVVAETERAEQVPEYLDGALAVLFETRLVLRPTRFALETQELQRDYADYWQPVEKRFDGRREP